MVAVTIERLSAALRGLDPQSRALLDLYYRRGMGETEIARFVGGSPDELARRRAALFDDLARDLELDGREQRAELQATLPDLPDRAWEGTTGPRGAPR